jgi:SAM-dependent methyltransferase
MRKSSRAVSSVWHSVAPWPLSPLRRKAMAAGSQLLDVGSSRVFVQRFITPSVIGSARCTVIDRRALNFHARIEPPHRFIPMDVVNADFADDTFDVILCNHTLAYVRDDHRALTEIFRCLKPDGLAMLDSGHDQEKTQSVDEYRHDHPELGDDYFAENGDQWVYGQDYFERLQAAGFRPRTDVLFDDYDAAFKREHGLKDHHELIVAFKSPTGDARFPPPHKSSQQSVNHENLKKK